MLCRRHTWSVAKESTACRRRSVAPALQSCVLPFRTCSVCVQGCQHKSAHLSQEASWQPACMDPRSAHEVITQIACIPHSTPSKSGGLHACLHCRLQQSVAWATLDDIQATAAAHPHAQQRARVHPASCRACKQWPHECCCKSQPDELQCMRAD